MALSIMLMGSAFPAALAQESPAEPGGTAVESPEEEPAATEEAVRDYLLIGHVDLAYRYLTFLGGDPLLYRRYVFHPEGLYSPSIDLFMLYPTSHYWRLNLKQLFQRDADSSFEIGHANRFRFWGLFNRSEFFSMTYFPGAGVERWGLLRDGSTRADFELGARRRVVFWPETDKGLNLTFTYQSKEQRRNSAFYQPGQSHWKYDRYAAAGNLEAGGSTFYLDLATALFSDLLPNSGSPWGRQSLSQRLGAGWNHEFSPQSLLTLRYDLNHTAVTAQGGQQTQRTALGQQAKAVLTQGLGDFLLQSRYRFEWLDHRVGGTVAANRFSLLAEPYVRLKNELDVALAYLGWPRTDLQLELQARRLDRNHSPTIADRFLNRNPSGSAHEGQAGVSFVTRLLPHTRLSAQYALKATDANAWPWFYTTNYLGLQNWAKLQVQYYPVQPIPWGVHARYELSHRLNFDPAADIQLLTHTLGLSGWLNPWEPLTLAYDGNFYLNAPSAGLTRRTEGLRPTFYTSDYLENSLTLSWQIDQSWAVGLNYARLDTWNAVTIEDHRLGAFASLYLTPNIMLGLNGGWENYRDSSFHDLLVNALFIEAKTRYQF